MGNLKFSVLVLFVCVVLAICLIPRVDSQGTIDTLEKQGYTEVEITGWRPFAASEEDLYATGFKAKSPSGQTVTGTVCSGLFKGKTIRFD